MGVRVPPRAPLFYEGNMHHKRGKSKNQRSGCTACKPWKINGVRTESIYGEKFSDHIRRTSPNIRDLNGHMAE